MPPTPAPRRNRPNIQFDPQDHFVDFDRDEPPNEARIIHQRPNTRSRGPAPNLPNVLRADPERSSTLRRELMEIHEAHEQNQNNQQPPINQLERPNLDEID